MQALDPELDLDRFFQGLGRARERVLLLDYDAAFPSPAQRGVEAYGPLPI